MPGASLSSTARVASGVTSRAVRPVPPVVRIRSAASPSAQAASAAAIRSVSSGTRRAVGEGVAAVRGPGRDRVARGVGALAAVAGVGDGEDGYSHGGLAEGRRGALPSLSHASLRPERQFAPPRPAGARRGTRPRTSCPASPRRPGGTWCRCRRRARGSSCRSARRPPRGPRGTPGSRGGGSRGPGAGSRPAAG